MFKQIVFFVFLGASLPCLAMDDSNIDTTPNIDYQYALTFNQEFKDKDMATNNSSISLSKKIFNFLAISGKFKDKYEGLYNVGTTILASVPVKQIYSAYTTLGIDKDIKIGQCNCDETKYDNSFSNSYAVGMSGPITDRLNGFFECDNFMKTFRNRYIEIGINYEVGGNMLVGMYSDEYQTKNIAKIGINLSYLF